MLLTIEYYCVLQTVGVEYLNFQLVFLHSKNHIMKPEKSAYNYSFAVLLVFVFSYLQTFSQHSLESKYNMFRVDDVITKQEVEYKDAGRSGKNVLWDFSNLNVQNDKYTIHYFAKGDSLVVGLEHRTMYYYSLSGDSLFLWGFENPTTLMCGEQPELLLKFPFHYEDSTFCYYNGNGKYSGRLKISNMGTVANKADAYGMMVLPDKDTLRNVIRIHSVKKIADGTEPLFFWDEKDLSKSLVSTDSINYRLTNDSIIQEVETYRWYARGYRYPIFETIKTITHNGSKEKNFFEVAFFYPPQEHSYLEEDIQNSSLLLKGEEEEQPIGIALFSYNYFPNPVADMLNLEYYMEEPSNIYIGLFDIYGKCLFQSNKKQERGIYLQDIDMSKYLMGNYILKIMVYGNSFDELIIKK